MWYLSLDCPCASNISAFTIRRLSPVSYTDRGLRTCAVPATAVPPLCPSSRSVPQISQRNAEPRLTFQVCLRTRPRRLLSLRTVFWPRRLTSQCRYHSTVRLWGVCEAVGSVPQQWTHHWWQQPPVFLSQLHSESVGHVIVRYTFTSVVTFQARYVKVYSSAVQRSYVLGTIHWCLWRCGRHHTTTTTTTTTTTYHASRKFCENI
jgi:hypothetical protein